MYIRPVFLLYINDLGADINDARCRLYADDTLLQMNSCGNPVTLRNNVNKLSDWATKWGMVFNTAKCIHMQVGRNNPDYRVQLNGTDIPTDNVIKYLGVYIQSNFKWHTHTSPKQLGKQINRSET